jgi:hypothetical protein
MYNLPIKVKFPNNNFKNYTFGYKISKNRQLYIWKNFFFLLKKILTFFVIVFNYMVKLELLISCLGINIRLLTYYMIIIQVSYCKVHIDFKILLKGVRFLCIFIIYDNPFTNLHFYFKVIKGHLLKI